MKASYFRHRTRSTNVLAIVGIVLFTVAFTLSAQQYLNLTISSVMTNDEFVQSGIGTLSSRQRAALDKWLNRYTSHVLQIASKPTTATASVALDRCTPTIETTIDGDFNGWEGETLFKLSNGQIWQQAEYSYNYSYAFMPEVIIYSTDTGCKLKVEDEDEAILVKRLK